MEPLQSVIFQDVMKSSWIYSLAGCPKGHNCLSRQVNPQILAILVSKKQLQEELLLWKPRAASWVVGDRNQLPRLTLEGKRSYD